MYLQTTELAVADPESTVELGPLELYLLVEVAADGLLRPGLVVEVGVALLLWIPGHVGHRLQI